MKINGIRRFASKIYVYFAALIGFPSFIQMELSTRCNLRCEMCEYNKLSGGSVVSFEQFKGTFDAIIKSNPFSKVFPRLMLFDLTGIGESFMNKDFLKILRYMKSKGVAITFATNATLLTKEISKKLIGIGVDILFFSIDGATKKTYEKIRRGANFEEVKRNIKYLSDLKKKLKKKKPKLMIRFLASSSNLEEMPLMIDFAKEIGVEGISITNMNTPSEESYLRADKKRFEELAENVKETAKNKGITIDIGFNKQRPITQCLRAFNSAYITCEGFVLPCCFINQGGQYDKIKKERNLGNVYEKNIKKIWNSAEYKKFRKSIKKGFAPEICKGCYLYYSNKNGKINNLY